MEHAPHAVEKEIVAILSEISGVEEEEIGPDTRFYEDLEIDSVKAIEITVALEKKFKISIRDEYVPTLKTLRDASELVNNLLAQKGA
jgi:acyl carrier protein